MLKRNFSNVIRFCFDQLLPPILRDSAFMHPFLRLVFGNYLNQLLIFRARAHFMSVDEFDDYYRNINVLQGNYHGNTQECVDQTLSDIVGETVIDVGCGRGHLAAAVAESGDYKVSGIDIIIEDNVRAAHPTIDFHVGRIEALPFEDNSFDTVTCTHTLEHIPNIRTALYELRRICRQRLILIVPLERPYRFGFNLHVQFFPYEHSFLGIVEAQSREFFSKKVGSDMYYWENLPSLKNP